MPPLESGLDVTLDIGAMFDQQLHGVGMFLLHGPHQSGGATQRFLRVYVGAALEQ